MENAVLVGQREEQVAAEDREISLFTPASDARDLEFSIVVPALNEENTIGARR